MSDGTDDKIERWRVMGPAASGRRVFDPSTLRGQLIDAGLLKPRPAGEVRLTPLPRQPSRPVFRIHPELHVTLGDHVDAADSEAAQAKRGAR